MGEVMQRIGSYVRHLSKARDRHAVHSPFVFGLIQAVLRQRDTPPECEAFEDLREQLLRNQERIRITDLGAGSHVLDKPERRIADIARTALKPKARAAMLFHLVRCTGSRHLLELGTSFGISTLYLAAAAHNGTVTTLEGCPATLGLADEHFRSLGSGNITTVQGDIRETLPGVLAGMEALDLVFLDGHHAKEPTLRYFEQCLTKAHNDTVLVLDDIHWSRGMEEAWETIKGHPRVRVSIDLYDMGLVFLRAQQARQHFVLRY